MHRALPNVNPVYIWKYLDYNFSNTPSGRVVFRVYMIPLQKLVPGAAGEIWLNIEVYYRDKEISADKLT